MTHEIRVYLSKNKHSRLLPAFHFSADAQTVTTDQNDVVRPAASQICALKEIVMNSMENVSRFEGYLRNAGL
jgi:hypothetical protein